MAEGWAVVGQQKPSLFNGQHMGGTDRYQNLVLVCVDVHRLIHAVNPDVIEFYQKKLCLNTEQLKKLNKLNKLRSLIHVENH